MYSTTNQGTILPQRRTDLLAFGETAFPPATQHQCKVCNEDDCSGLLDIQLEADKCEQTQRLLAIDDEGTIARTANVC